jgi:hypothetical protein
MDTSVESNTCQQSLRIDVAFDLIVLMISHGELMRYTRLQQESYTSHASGTYSADNTEIRKEGMWASSAPYVMSV